MRLHHIAASLLLALPIVAGCKSDDTLNSPNVIDPMFRRYAALGNSITAGFQSAGINDSTQRRAYPALLAAAMGTSYTYPSLNMPGCPPPLTNNVTLTRVGGGTPSTCALKPIRFELLNNLAVPGNDVISLLNNFSGSPSQFDPLKTIMLGGRTEVELMMQLKPTFVTVWAGSNDVLGALISSTNPGDPAEVNPAAKFIVQYDSLVDSLRATGAKVVLIGIPDVRDRLFGIRRPARALARADERRAPVVRHREIADHVADVEIRIAGDLGRIAVRDRLFGGGDLVVDHLHRERRVLRLAGQAIHVGGVGRREAVVGIAVDGQVDPVAKALVLVGRLIDVREIDRDRSAARRGDACQRGAHCEADRLVPLHRSGLPRRLAEC